MQAAGTLEQPVGQLERVGVARAAAEHERQQFVVAESRRAEPFQLFARAIVRRDVFHQYTRFGMLRRSSRALACLAAALLCLACAEPPNKEMDQAQGAIDAARAAGADRYATTEYAAATDALKNANEAVAASATTAWRSTTRSKAASTRRTPRATPPTPRPASAQKSSTA